MGLICLWEPPWARRESTPRWTSPKCALLSSRTVHYNPTNSKHLVFSVSAIPEQLQGQMSVLRYFASYMEQHLMKVSAGAQGWVLGHGLTTPLGLVGLSACSCGQVDTQSCALRVGTPLRGYPALVLCVLVEALPCVWDQWLM